MEDKKDINVNGAYQVTREKGYKKIHVSKNPELEFDFEFDMYVPIDCRANSNILFNYSKEGFKERSKVLMETLKAPVMIPVIEDLNGLNYTELEPEALLDESGNVRTYGSLSTGLIEQYRKAIDVAYAILKKEKIVAKDNKGMVDVEGYSYNGVCAQRLAMVIPEKVRSLICGGAISSIPMPVEKYEGQDLEYPIGFARIEKYTGRSFDEILEDYKKIAQVYYATEQELKYDGRFSITGEEVRKVDGTIPDPTKITVSQHDISPDVVQVVKKQVELFGTDINERIAAIKTIHEKAGTGFKKTKIYEGSDHHFTDEARRMEPIYDYVAMIASLDTGLLIDGEIAGFDGGAEKIDTSYEEKRTELKKKLMEVPEDRRKEVAEELVFAMMESDTDDKFVFDSPKPFVYEIGEDVYKKAAERIILVSSMKSNINIATDAEVRESEVDEARREESKVKDNKQHTNEGEEYNGEE